MLFPSGGPPVSPPPSLYTIADPNSACLNFVFFPFFPTPVCFPLEFKIILTLHEEVGN